MKKLIMIYAFVLLVPAAAFAQGTGFNFQGRLNDGTTPANGHYDLQFRLYDTLTGGNQIGVVLSRPNTILVNGVFSTTLDFGASAFNSPNNVFIEISIRPAGSPNALTILGPRQQLTAVPFAVRAANATNADNAALAVNAQHSVDAQLAVNAQNAVNAISANNATTATTAQNALALGGVAPAGWARLNVQNTGDVLLTGKLQMTGDAFQSVASNGLVKAMVTVSSNTTTILRCYNGITNVSSGNCGFIVTAPLDGVLRIDFGFPVLSRFVLVSPQYQNTGSTDNNNGGANYRFFDATSVEVFTFEAGDSEDTQVRGFTIIMF